MGSDTPTINKTNTSPQPNRQYRRLWVSIIAVLLVFVVGFYGFVSVANLTTHDESPPTEASLQLPDLQIDETVNAYVTMRGITTFTEDLDAKLFNALEADAWDDAYITTLATQHMSDVAVFRSASKLKTYQNPLYEHPAIFSMDTATFPNLTPYRKVAQVAALEAIQQAKSGSVNQGLDEAFDVVRFGHLMESGQNSLIEYLVGSAIKQTGLTAIRKIALDSEIDPTQARDRANALEAYRDSSMGQANAVKVEALGSNIWPSTYEQLSRNRNSYYNSDGVEIPPNAWQRFSNKTGLLPIEGNIFTRSLAYALWVPIVLTRQTQYYYLPNQTKHLINNEALNRLQLAESDCQDIVDTNLTQPAYLNHRGLTLLFTRNSVGLGILDLGHVSYGSLKTKRCNESVAISATQATLGLKAYLIEKGSLPTSLSSLIPTYLKTIPIDPYNEQPLRYDEKKTLLYSVGSDRIDSGGGPILTAPNTTDTADPTFAIPVN